MAAAQAPAWQTAIATPGTSLVVQAAAPDAAGNLIVVGNFANSATFGTTTFTSTGTGNDGFVAKWSPAAGRFLWAQQISGLDGEYVTSVAVSGSHIYVGGVFSGRMATVGSVMLSNTDFMGNNDLFVARLTDTGTASTIDWALRAGAQPSETLTGLAISGNNLYVVGTYSGSGTVLGTIALSNAAASGSANIFVAKLVDASSAATFEWAVPAGGPTGGNNVAAVAATGSSVYLAGSYLGTGVRFGTLLLPPANNIDCYVAKLTDAGGTGSFVWTQAAGGTQGDVVTALAVSGPNVYLAGRFASPTLTIGSSVLANTGSLDAFVAKLTDTGNAGSLVWGQAAGGTGAEVINALAVSGPHLYATGYSSSPQASFGSGSMATVGDNDAFLTKLTDAGSTGSFAWVRPAGGTGFDSGAAVVIQGSQVYVAGIFTSPVLTFSPTLALARPGLSYALFLASLPDATLTATAPARGGTGLTLYPNPAGASTTVQLPALPGTAVVTIVLSDALGRTVRAATVPMPATELRYELSLTGLAPGPYVLQTQTEAATATRRLLVK
ncbi:hypothetical protein GCM10027594_27660 [Hymenobacter agri]